MVLTNAKVNKVLMVSMAILVAFIGYGWYRYSSLNKQHEVTKTEKSDLETKSKQLEKQVADLFVERTSLTDALNAEQAKNTAFQNQIDSITGTVGTLQKLKSIDPELLKKYSKVSFLNENYFPKAVVNIDAKFLLPDSKPVQFLTEAWPFLSNLLVDANSSGVQIKILSSLSKKFLNACTLLLLPSIPGVHKLYSSLGSQLAKNPKSFRLVLPKDPPIDFSGTATITFFNP